MLRNVSNDAYWRYFHLYYSGQTGIKKLQILTLIFPVVGMLCFLTDRNLRSQPLGKRLLLLACIGYMGVAALDTRKCGNYLVFFVLVLTACGAVWVYTLWQARGRGRLVSCFLLAISIGATLVGVGYKIHKDEYHHLYNPAVVAVRGSLPPGGLVLGPSELGFALGFGPQLVDAHFGYSPDVLVSPWYRAPIVYSGASHIPYHLVFQNAQYSVYVCKTAPAVRQPAN